MHSYMRCKYAYLEDTPTIKGYAEGDWAEKAPDATGVAVEASVLILTEFINAGPISLNN